MTEIFGVFWSWKWGSSNDLQNFFSTRTAARNAKRRAFNDSPFILFASDPGGIQTHDLQNRNLTLYSAKLQDHFFIAKLQNKFHSDECCFAFLH